MKREYNMTGATRATEVEHLNRLRSGKTRITIMLDNDMLEAFRARAEEQGMGYQTVASAAGRAARSISPVGWAPPTKKEAQSVRWVGGDSQISKWEPPTRTALQPFLTLNFCIALQGVFPPRSQDSIWGLLKLLLDTRRFSDPVNIPGTFLLHRG
jgi:microcystin-dependent protein